MRLADGEDGVGTTSLAVSAEGSLIATTDTAGRVAIRYEERGWRLEEFADYQDHCLGPNRTTRENVSDESFAGAYPGLFVGWPISRFGGER